MYGEGCVKGIREVIYRQYSAQLVKISIRRTKDMLITPSIIQEKELGNDL